MKFFILLLFVIISLQLHAQTKINASDTGIRFVSGLNWERIKERAKMENKYIFVDCYTTWCAPCKYMSQTIFQQKEVGDYFNAHFINVAVQMDETDKDSKEAQQWYVDAKSLETKYSVEEYPTYLFFSPEGEAIHRIVGGFKDGNEFITKTKDVFSPAKQYYTVIGHFKEHLSDSLFLRNALTIALEDGDQANASAIGDAYIGCLKEPYSKENIRLIVKVTRSSRDKGFQLLLANPIKADEAWGEETWIEQNLRMIIEKELVDSLLRVDNGSVNWTEIVTGLKSKYPTLGNGDDFVKGAEYLLKKALKRQELNSFYITNNASPNWESIGKKLEERYKGFDIDRFIAEQKVDFYEYKKDRLRLEKALSYYASHYGDQLSNYDLNNIAWDIFLNSTHRKLLLVGLKMSKKSISNYPKAEIGDIDTYANLLYKLGNTKLAIVWEKRAIALIKTHGYEKEFETTLGKMQRGEKTWLDNSPSSN
jgi:thioredoxin-related protein